MTIIDYKALQIEYCSRCGSEMKDMNTTKGQKILYYSCPNCINAFSILAKDKQEHCPKCHKQVDRFNSFPEYPGGQGDIFQCEHCGYTTAVYYG